MNAKKSQSLSGANTGVIIPVYNRAQTLVRTLPYVAAQTAPPRQLIIVDDGSTDESAEAARRWLSEHKPAFGWQVIRSPHVGAAEARNVGLAALGEVSYVAFLDSDDHWPADFLERTTALLQENPAAVAASVDRCYLTSDGTSLREDDSSALARDPISWMFFHGAGIASCTLLRQEVVHQAGNWSAQLEVAEDLKLFAEVAQRGLWLHSPGQPVEFGVGAAAAYGEAANLSQRYEQADWRWICVYEQIYQELRDRDFPIDYGKLQEAIAIVWNRVGKHFLKHGARGEAQNCFMNSIRWKPAQLRAWRRLVMSTIMPSKARTGDHLSAPASLVSVSAGAAPD